MPAFTKVLGDNEVFIPLNDEEVVWLNAFTGSDRRVIEMSEGIVEGSKVIVLSGSFVGHEAEIKRIDRHRRMAELEVSMLGRMKRYDWAWRLFPKAPRKHRAEGESSAAIGRRKADNRGPASGRKPWLRGIHLGMQVVFMAVCA